MTSYILCKLEKFKIVNKNEWVTRNRWSEDRRVWKQATKKYGMSKAEMNLVTESVRNSVAGLPHWTTNTGSCWASNEILHLLWNLKIFYCALRALPLVSDLCHMNPLHSFPPLLIEIQVTAALPNVVHFKWPLTCFRLRTLWSIFLSCGPCVILYLMIMKIQQYN
jgi:hypothetical protein